MLHLPAEPARTIADHRNGEATFSVGEADDPLLYSWPFLLIVRTERIFTAHAPPYETGET